MSTHILHIYGNYAHNNYTSYILCLFLMYAQISILDMFNAAYQFINKFVHELNDTTHK